MKSKHLIFKPPFIFIAMLLFSSVAQALQIKETNSDGEIEAFIALDELSRIKAINDRITSIKSNEGDLEIVEDTRLGEIYLRPSKGNQEPINIFIITEKNQVYKLLLLPKKMPSEQIFIKNIELHTDKKVERKDSLKEEVLSLIRAMQSEQHSFTYNDNYQIKAVNNQKVAIKFAFLMPYLKGEVVEFSNEESEQIKLTPEQFYEQGIIALSLDKEELGAGEKTNIYVVREVVYG